MGRSAWRTVDVAIRRGAEKPRVDYPPINVYWFSGRAFTEGVETHTIDAVKVKIYSPEKTIADVFKYRGKLGMEVALEALQSWSRSRRRSVDELLAQARHCRTETVIRPYLEALL